MWTPEETKLLLDYYYKYSPQVHTFKRFKNKKMLFKEVSQDLAELLGSNKTPQQCENHYNMIRQPQKQATSDINNKSGATPRPVPFHEEMRKTQSIDNSLKPEVHRDSFRLTYKPSSSSDSSDGVASMLPSIKVGTVTLQS